jgi:Fe-S cluster biogenesis protein NfuA
MQDEPTPTELIQAVAEFLSAEIAPQITGHAGF